MSKLFSFGTFGTYHFILLVYQKFNTLQKRIEDRTRKTVKFWDENNYDRDAKYSSTSVGVRMRMRQHNEEGCFVFFVLCVYVIWQIDK
jgi:hypothetical protein